MKIDLLKKLLITGSFVFCCATTTYSASTPPLSILSQETVQNMSPNTSQIVSYVVKNNVPVAPVMLNISPNRTMLVPFTPYTSWEISDDCVYRGMKHFIPPSGRCNVKLLIRAGAINAHIQQNVLINYGPTFQIIAPAPLLSFDISGSPSAFYFTVEPTGNNMQINTTQTLTWTVKNTTANNIRINNATINFTVASPLIAPPVFTNDCGNIVIAGGTCNISTTIQALSTPGTVSQYLSIPYDSNSTLVADQPTSFSILSSLNTRTLHFVNLCPYNVWLAFVGGGQLFGCATNADCDNKPNVTPGTFVCDPTAAAGAGICNWRNPVPPGGNYKLLANGGSTQVTLVENVYPLTQSQHLVWSGVIGGRTSCDDPSGVCTTGDCGGGQGGCPVGKGLSQPAQQAEPTFQQESDFYDITGINGINVPMSIAPNSVTIGPSNPYTCGATGTTSPQVASGGTIGACSWNFVPPTNNFIWVADNGISCTLNNECDMAHGEACGLSRASILANSAQRTCGIFEGYWTANEVCGINPGYALSPYFCNSPATNGTFTNMYQCTGTGYNESCYNTSASSCCGCQNWQDPPTNLQIPSTIPQCSGTNSFWTNDALPTLSWYKAACPPFYVYPFDDKSSTFSCTNQVSGINSTSYTITYCPGGNSGAPVGVVPNP